MSQTKGRENLRLYLRVIHPGNCIKREELKRKNKFFIEILFSSYFNPMFFGLLLPGVWHSVPNPFNHYFACINTTSWRIPCSIKILRVSIFADIADLPRSAKISSHRKKKAQNKMPQKLTPFSQIKNSPCNRLVPLGRYTLDLNKNINMTFYWKKQPELRYIR